MKSTSWLAGVSGVVLAVAACGSSSRDFNLPAPTPDGGPGGSKGTSSTGGASGSSSTTGMSGGSSSSSSSSSTVGSGGATGGSGGAGGSTSGGAAGTGGGAGGGAPAGGAAGTGGMGTGGTGGTGGSGGAGGRGGSGAGGTTGTGGAKDAGAGGSMDASTPGLGFSIGSAAQATIVQGGSVGITVNITRTTDQGAITLTGTSLPTGVTASPVTVPAGANQGTLTLNATASATQVAAATIGIHAVGASGSTDASLRLQVRGSSGALDTTFGTGGFQAINVVFDSNARASAGPNGVVVAGQTSTAFLVAGLTRAGALNPNFGTSGTLTFGSHSFGALATPPRLDGNGRWVWKYHGQGKNVAVRVTGTGSPDSTFSGDGILDLTARMGNTGGIVPLSAGGYVVGTETSAPMSSTTFVMRHLDDQGNAVGADDTTRSLLDGIPAVSGQPARAIIDPSSGSDAMCTLGASGDTPSCSDLPAGLSGYSVVRMESGRANRSVVAFGSPTPAVLQFSDTAIDTTFAGGRRDVTVPSATSPNLQGLSVIEVNFKEEIYVLGDAAFGATRNIFVAKLDEGGNYVTSFGTNGFSIVDYPNLGKEVGVQVWPEGENLYLLFLSTDAGESASLKGKLHVARLWR